jgi:type IV pilus assembly protein PilV
MILHCGSNSFQIQRRSLLKSNNSGYLLVEALIAVGIFSIGILAIGTLTISTVKANISSNLSTQAALLAAETLESLKAKPVKDLSPSSHSDSNNPIDEWGNAGGIFTRSWVIDDPLGYDTSRRIRVAVKWEHFGQSRCVELTTITRGNGS